MQKNNHLFNFISSKLDEKTYDLLLYHVNNVLFNYGDHQKVLKFNLSYKFNFIIKYTIQFVTHYLLIAIKNKKKKKVIISNSNVNLIFNDYYIVSPPWNLNFKNKFFTTYKLSNVIFKIQLLLLKKSLKVLFSENFKNLMCLFEIEFKNFLIVNDVKCVVFKNDMSFFENLSIKIAKKNNIPTLVYLHGLPSRYNKIDDNRAEYLIVWCKGIKAAYLKSGVFPDKILTIKHPVYSDFKNYNLVSSLDHVLVLTKAIAGTPSSSNKLFFGDRSKSLLYIEQIKSILIEFGVKNARLRLHPSESLVFYKNNLIDDFFIIDLDDKIRSIKKSSLVIGPSSTMVLDSIKTGVNYILYEPKIDNILFDNSSELVSPFDGLSFIKLSKTIEEIKYHIENPSINIDFFKLNEFFEIVDTDYQKLTKILK